MSSALLGMSHDFQLLLCVLSVKFCCVNPDILAASAPGPSAALPCLQRRRRSVPTATSADGFREPDGERRVGRLRRDTSPAAGKADGPLAAPPPRRSHGRQLLGSPTGGRAVLAARGAHRYPDRGWDRAHRERRGWVASQAGLSRPPLPP